MDESGSPSRVIHVLTLASSTGAYGGPLSVASAQVATLERRGVPAVLLAGYMRSDVEIQRSPMISGARVRVFPTVRTLPRGFAGFMSPQLWWWLWRNLRSDDVVHIHFARDYITVTASWIVRLKRGNFVVQTHGMIERSSAVWKRLYDHILVRPILRTAAVVLVLNSQEDRAIGEVEPSAHTQILLNGIRVDEDSRTASPPADLEVLFLARLNAKKRPDFFLDACEMVAAKFPAARFTLAGPDGGMTEHLTSRVEEMPESIRIEPPVHPDRVRERLERAAVVVNCTKDEPFGMVLLEAMLVGRPVIAMDTCGLAADIERFEAGILIEDDPAQLASALETLLNDESRRAAVGSNGRKLVSKRYSIEAVVEELHGSVYVEAGLRDD